MIKPLPQAHLVYAEVTEAKQQFDQMAEDNCKAVAGARDRVTSFQNNQTDMESIELRCLGYKHINLKNEGHTVCYRIRYGLAL